MRNVELEIRLGHEMADAGENKVAKHFQKDQAAQNAVDKLVVVVVVRDNG